MDVKIYTDGAARGNPDGPGGYGAVLVYTDQEGKVYKKKFPPATGKPPTTVWS